MTPQAQIPDPIPSRPLLEDLERQLAVLSEGYAAYGKNLADTRTELQQQIEQVDRRLIEVDVKLTRKIDALDVKLTGRVDALDVKVDALDIKLTGRVDALDTKVDALDIKVGALDTKVDALDIKVGALDTKVGALGAQLSLITTHLGIEQGAAPEKPPAARGAKPRKARTR